LRTAFTEECGTRIIFRSLRTPARRIPREAELQKKNGSKRSEAQPDPTPACTAQSFAAGRPSITPQLPAVPFKNVGLTPWRSPAPAPAGTRISQTAFRFLRRLPVSRPPSREGPGLPLRCVAESSLRPFGLRLPPSLRLAPVRARSPPQTRFPTQILQSQSAPGSLLPFGVFAPLRIEALTRPPIKWLTSRMRPIALRSPPPTLLE
jgi:hypothetical protein